MSPFAPLRAALLSLSLLSASAALAAPVRYAIDPTHSAVQFSISHLGVSRVVGRFNEPQGNFVYDATQIGQSSARLSVPAATVDSGNRERDDHLRSSDFLDVARYAQIRFESTAVAGSAGQFTLTGNLTLLGKTRPVSFAVHKIGEGRDPWGGYRAGFEATAVVKRSDFGLTYMLGAIGDEATLTVEIEGIRQP